MAKTVKVNEYVLLGWWTYENKNKTEKYLW